MSLSGHTNVIWSATFSTADHGLSILASASSDKTIKLWDVQTGKEMKTLFGHSLGVTCVTFSPKDGAILASTSFDHTIKLWDVKGGKEIR